MDEQWYEPLRWTLSATPPDSDIVAKLLAVSRAVKIKDFHLICPLSTLLRAAAPVLATVQMREAFSMSVTIDIVPSSETLDMYGEPDQLAAYSLSGHVAITLSSAVSFLERRRAVRILLQSLVITFEGQSELVTEETGYSACRLCLVSKDLMIGEPVELSNEDADDADGMSVWNIVFSLAIPGWLPASSPFGDVGGGTQYALYASATLEHIEDLAERTWLSTLCSPFFSPLKTLKARVSVEVNRYISPSMHASSSTSAFPSTCFAVKAQTKHVDESSAFPQKVLSKVLVQVSMPEKVDLDEGSLPFTLSLRTDGLSATECAKLRATSFSVDVEQIERYRCNLICLSIVKSVWLNEHHRTVPNASYRARYPMPPSSQQPPTKKLLHPHPVHALYQMGMTAKACEEHVLSRTFSLLPDDVAGQYKVAGDGYIFENEKQAQQTWFSLSTSVSLASSNPIADSDDWKYARSKRPTADSPLLNVSHRMYMSLTCTYDVSDGEQATQHLRFHIPLRFVRIPPFSPLKSRSLSPSISDVATEPNPHASSVIDLLPPSAPYAHILPAYSQLFHSNGDRKIDYSFPLPRYTPHPSDADLKLPLHTVRDEVVNQIFRHACS
ncbi:hypothetical protein EIP86_004385 [Pleurotus ostreatoroseus]|nr:hypothetical protein EIP86_004385 [Pleurotus ostreatoroseus]